ncbi:hypothetical protein K4A83_22130 [Spirulina subsalsa FACHB-351]|uniref:Fluorescence recovery protein n=1 Tax=Spirulina subsalsa FACHB-351 TaxID=234711 RepID=A0ABT3LBN9_9CYAN|nr:hypothetical protein [Spirulina subsalsa]MCW6038929.1 hypothetical protein [Spirulina subsalsa FACHB-351]
MSEIDWSEEDKNAAVDALHKAYKRELKILIDEVKQKAFNLTEVEEVWKLHDFLSARRHDIDGKYDYRDAASVFVLATLVKQGWLSLEELQVLSRDKLAKISALTRI